MREQTAPTLWSMDFLLRWLCFYFELPLLLEVQEYSHVQKKTQVEVREDGAK